MEFLLCAGPVLPVPVWLDLGAQSHKEAINFASQPRDMGIMNSVHSGPPVSIHIFCCQRNKMSSLLCYSSLPCKRVSVYAEHTGLG